MQVSFVGSFPKALDYPDANEDCFVINDDQQRMALCDGASESFDSKTWARSLAHRFVIDPSINSNWVQEAASSYQSQHDFSTLSWSKQAAFERGSFATLLGIEFDAVEGSASVVAIGDSIAFLVESRMIVESWPYHTAEQFSQRPLLLSTISALNEFVAESDFHSKHSVRWRVGTRADAALLCMTDALGQWTLQMIQERDSSWERLLAIQSTEELGNLVQTERAAKRMRVDDSTLIVVRF